MTRARTILSIVFFIRFCLITELSFAQKLLDPGVPLSVVVASSGGANTSVATAYSVRQLKTIYDHPVTITPPSPVAGFTNSTTPLLRVRRDTDNGQLDIGYDSNGNLDSVVLKNFVTNNGANPSANGRVTVWYDQSGNSRDAYPPTTAHQMYIISSGVVQRNSGGQIGIAGIAGGMMEYRPTASTTFNGGAGANIYGIDSNRTLNVVSQPRAYTNGASGDGAGTYLIDRYGDPLTANGGTPSGIDQPLTCLKAISGNWALQLRLQDGTGIGNSFSGSIAISTARSDNVMAIRSGNVYYLYVNGVLAGSTTLAGYNPMSPVRIGYGSSTSENVYYGEFILFPSALSGSDLTTLNVSQGDYFFTGAALNVWSGAVNTNWATAGNWTLATLPDALADVTIPNGTPNSPIISGAVTVKSITIAPGATLTNNSTLNLSSNLTVNGTLGGSGTVVMNGGIEQTISGTTTPIVFNNLTISNTANNVVTNNNINVTGTLTVNAGAVFAPAATAVVNDAGAGSSTITGSGTVLVTRTAATANYQNQYKFSTNTLTNLTVNYAGLGDQSITLAGVTHGHIAVSGSGVKALSAAVTTSNVTGNISVLGATLHNGGFDINGAGGRTFLIADNATFITTYTSTTPFPRNYGTYSLSSNSTVNYGGTGAQTVVAQSYGNLTSSSSGARTLSGTIGIAGAFTPGTNSYIITGSTVNYNGTGAQTIAAFNYQSLTVSGAHGGADITFAPGSVGITGTASFTATGVGSWIVTDNTVNYSGSGQTVLTIFPYNNLTYSGSGNKTGAATINGVFSLEGTAVAGSGLSYGENATLQYNKPAGYTSTNNEWPATFNGTGGVIIRNSGTITVNAAKAITNALAIETGATLNLNAITTHTSTYLTLGGVLQTASGSYGGTGSGATNINSTFFTTGAGRISINVKTWSGASNTDWNTTGNWNPSGVPTGTDNVIIPSAPGNQPVVSAAATCQNLLLNNGASLSISNTLTITGNFVNQGATVSGAGTIAFSGTSRTISGLSTTFPNVTISDGATISISGSHSCANFTIAAGGSNTSFTHIADADLSISGTVTLNQPNTNSRSKSWNINAGSATVGGLITIGADNTSTTTSRVTEMVITTGTLNANAGITFTNVNNTGRRIVMNTGAGRINIQGAFTLNGQHTLTAGTSGSTINFTGSTAQTIPFFSSGGYCNVEINNTGGAALSAAVTTSNVTGNIVVGSGTLSNNTFAITGNVAQAFSVSDGATFTLTGTAAFPTGFGTITLATNSTVNYSGTAAQTVAARSYQNLTLSGARTGTNSITLASGIISVAGTFTPSATFGTGNYVTTDNTIEFNGSSSQTVPAFNYNSLTSSSTGERILSGTIGISGVFTPGSNAYTVTGSTVNYNGTGAQTIAPMNYNHLTISGSRASNNITFASGETVAVAGTLSLSASFTSGNYVVTNNTVAFNGSISQTIPAFTYNHLTSASSGARVLANSGTIDIAGVFTPGTNAYTNTSSTLRFNGSISQTIPAFKYNNLISSSSGARVLDGSDTIAIAGTFTPGSNTYTITGSTLNFNGSGSQTIPAFNYNNLVSSSGGARTLASSGTIGIAGTFIPGTNTYTIAGSTVNYNGTDAQTITAFEYQSLTISGARSGADITLEPGVIGIAGTATFSATGVGSWIVADNTVNYNGSGQTVANFTYNNLTLSGTGSITTSTSVIVNGVRSLESTAVMSNAITYGADATLQFNKPANYTTNTVNWPTPFDGAGGVIIQNAGRITLNEAKAITGGLSIETGATLSLGGFNHTAAYLILGGIVQTANGSYGRTGSGATNINNTYFTTTNGTVAIAIKTWIGSPGSSWYTNSNWSPVNRPTTSSTVIIPSGGQPVITEDETHNARNIVLQSGSTLTFVNNRTLVISGNFVNEGGTISGAAGTVQFSGANRTITGTSTSFPNLTINNGASVSLSGSHSCTNFTIATGGSNTSLTHIADASLSVSGTVTIPQPSSNTRNKSWNINAGSATVTGLISYTLTASTNTSRVQEIVITTGTLNANGGITFANVNNTGRRIIMSGGAGRINLQGDLALNGQQTLTAGTSGSTFNFAGTSAQTILYFSSGAYHNLETNNTAGASLSAAVTTSNVTGNILVSSGTLRNNAFAIAGNGSRSFTVANGATFMLTGGTAFPTGFGTFVIDSNSTVNYGGASQNVAARQYGHLTISGTGTKTPLSGTHTIYGNFLISASTYNASTNNPIYVLGGNFTRSGGTYTTGTGAFTLAGSTQVINNTHNLHNLIINSSISATLAANTTISNVVGGNVTIGAGSRLDLSTFTLSRSSGLGTLTINGTLGLAGTSNFPSNFAMPPTMGPSGTVDYNASAGGQTVLSTFYQNLTLSNTSGTSTAAGSLSVAGILSTTAGGTLDMGVNTFSSLGSVDNNGTISTSNTTSAPLPNDVNWNGTIRYGTATGSQTVVQGTYNNLTLSNTSGTNIIGGSVSTAGVLLMSGGKLALGANTLTINGTLSGMTASSSFVANGSSNLTIGGSGALGTNVFFDQTTPGVTNRLADLTYNRSGAANTIGDTIEVANVLTLSAGTLATNDRLKLISNAGGTARVAQVTGSITGNVSVERFIPSVARRWRFLGSPVSGSTLADLKNEIFITGDDGVNNGFDSTAANKPSVYSYDETDITGDLNSGWVTATHITNAIAVGKGYRVFVRGDRSDWGRLDGTNATQNEVILNFVGPLNTGNITMPVSFSSSGVADNDGWCFVANPYASPIDWNAFHDAGRSGTPPDFSGTDYARLSPIIYIYNAATGSYVSYNAVSNSGTGSLSSGIIPSGGGFWVQTTAASPSMTMKETYKVSGTPAAVFKTSTTPFRIILTRDSITNDELVLKYTDEASDGVDVYDIRKMYGSEVDIAGITNDGQFLSLNCKPFKGYDSIPLSIGIATSGTYTLTFSEKDKLGIGPNYSILLVDRYTKQVTDIDVQSTISFHANTNESATFGNNRFYILIKEAVTGMHETVNDSDKRFYVYPSATHDRLALYSRKQINGPVHIRLVNEMGVLVADWKEQNWQGQNKEMDLSVFAPGVYFIQVQPVGGATQILKCIKF